MSPAGVRRLRVLADPIAVYMAATAASRFDCPVLRANITYCCCITRQAAEPKKVRTRTGLNALKVQRTWDVYCRSGECKLGRKIRRENGRKCA